MMTEDDATAPPRHASSKATSLVIRSATAEDALGIAKVHVVSWRSTYAGLLAQSLLDDLSVEKRTVRWRQNILSREATIQVALNRAGQVAGFIATGSCRETDAGNNVGELWAIYVRPDLCRQGIGRQLHAAGLASLTAKFEEAKLWVLEGNTAARAFYQREGWQSDGILKRDTIGETAVTELRYHLSLRP